MAFVKFSRGLQSTYNNLINKDPDTLYLVYESADSLNGSLYLGTKLISSVNTPANMSLNDLTDVVISSNELADGMLLYYNASTGGGRWEAGSLSDIISDLPSGRDRVSIVDALNTISNPQDKDIAIVGQDVYIYSIEDEEWSQLTDSSLISRISNLENQVGQAGDESQGIAPTGLYKDIADLKETVYTKEEITQYIADLAHLKYEVVESVDDIDVNDDAASTTIYLVPKISGEVNNGYDEYFVVNGVLEKIGSLDIDLSNYVQTDDTRLLTNIQKQKIDSLGQDENGNATIQASQVGALPQAIQENQLIKSVEPGTFEVTPQGQLQLKSVPSIDLSGYVKTVVFESTVGNLNDINNRVSENSSIVEEINSIKESILWKRISGENE